MLISGKIESLHGGKQKVLSQLIVALEEARCEVSREQDELVVLVPGWDAAIVPFAGKLPFVQHFWDRVILNLSDDGTLHYRLVYWSLSQIILHVLLTGVFAFEFFFGGNEWTLGQFFTYALTANAIPLITCFFSVQYMRHVTLKKFELKFKQALA